MNRELNLKIVDILENQQVLTIKKKQELEKTKADYRVERSLIYESQSSRFNEGESVTDLKQQILNLRRELNEEIQRRNHYQRLVPKKFHIGI